MMPRKVIDRRDPEQPARCDRPVAYDNRGFPVRRCEGIVELLLGDRHVAERCAFGHPLSMRPVVREKFEWYEGSEGL